MPFIQIDRFPPKGRISCFDLKVRVCFGLWGFHFRTNIAMIWMLLERQTLVKHKPCKRFTLIFSTISSIWNLIIQPIKNNHFTACKCIFIQWPHGLKSIYFTMNWLSEILPHRCLLYRWHAIWGLPCTDLSNPRFRYSGA